MTQETKKKCTFWGVFILVATLILASAYFLPGVFASEEEESISQPEAFLQDETNPPESSKILGTVSGEGNFFEIKDSTYLNITLESTAKIKARVESIPEMITINLEKLNQEDEITQLTIKNLVPNTTYHLYTDDYHNYTPLLSDEEGKAIFEVELSSPHILFIQTKKSTKFIRPNATGGDCYLIGNWDGSTKTCTLTQNVSETIQVENTVTLDGNGKTLIGSGTGNGIYIPQNTYNVTIKNIKVTNFSYGVYASSVRNLTISNSSFYNNPMGIDLHCVDYPNITNNVISTDNVSSSTGISLDGVNYGTINHNSITLKSNFRSSNGIYLYYSRNNNIFDNSIETEQYGIFIFNGNFYNVFSHNILRNNSSGIRAESSYGGYTSGNNDITENLFINNRIGLLVAYNSYTRIWANNFINNSSYQAYIATPTSYGNIFYLPLPKGGNYWNNWITPDKNNDGWVDSPYAVPNNHFDNYPRTKPTDSISPITTIVFSGEKGENDWFKSNVVINLSAQDDPQGYGIDKIEYSWDGQNWQKYIEPFSIDKEGITYFYYRSIDLVGNIENTKQATIKIDKTNPEISANFNGTIGANDWYVSDVTATLSATDNIAIDKIEYSFDGENWQEYSTPVVLDYAGIKTFYYRTSDLAGNVAEGSQVIKIDKNPPETSISLEGAEGDNGWYKSNVLVTLLAQDNEGGLGEKPTEYSFDGESWQEYSGPFTISEEGEFTLYYRSKDLAGNVENTKQSTIKIDKTAPTILATRTPANENGWNNSDVEVGFTCTDNLSGVESCSPNVIVSGEGENQSVTGTATDVAGNISMILVENINIDKTSPVINGSRAPEANLYGWNREDVVVHFECSDNLSGVDFLTQDQTITTEGENQSREGICVDKAGNSVSTIVSGINIDKTAPETTDDYLYDGIWTNADATILLTAFDQEGLSGIEKTKYCIDSDGTCNPLEGEDYTEPIKIEDEGVFYLRYQSQDRAGNLEEVKQAVVMIDKTAPVASIEVKDARDDQCSFFFQLWIDNGQVSYDVVHGCSEVAASIDASIAGLKDYKLILKNSNGDIVKEVENNSLFFNFESGESVYTIVLEAYDNAGNFVTTSRTIYEDDDNDVATLEANGGAPDLFDLCPAQIPSEDLNKDGCQDVEGVNVNSLNWCIDTYTGRAETSLYPTTSLTQIGDSFVKHHRTWYQMQSKINSGVETGYAMNILDMQGRNRDEIHCSIDANNLKLSSGEELVYTKKDNAKLVYKEIFGRMIVKEKYHAHELSDGAKIFATMKYDEKRGESYLHLVFSNPEKTVSCIKEADRERDRCQENCGRRDLRCHKECNEQAVRAKIKCVQDNNYQLKQEYEGYRTLSLFDILKLIGYEE